MEMTLAVSQAEAFNVYTLTKAAFLPQMTRNKNLIIYLSQRKTITCLLPYKHIKFSYFLLPASGKKRLKSD